MLGDRTEDSLPKCCIDLTGYFELQTCAAADWLAGVKGGSKSGVPANGGTLRTTNLQCSQEAEQLIYINSKKTEQCQSS